MSSIGGNTMATTEAENKELVRQLVDDVFNEGNPDALDDYLTEDYVEHTVAVPGGLEGLEAVREYYSDIFNAFPDFEVTIQDLLAEGDKVVQRSLQGGTHEGPFLDIEPTGESAEIPGIVIYRIEDGQIAESWPQADLMGFMQQIGVMEGPGA